MTSNEIKDNQITTDDLAFSAYLRMKGYSLIKSNQKEAKVYFTFEVNGNIDQLKVEFINSEIIQFYNELRNLKKMISTK